MLKSTGQRALIELDGFGVRLRGTYHLPAGCSEDRADLNRIGVVLVNSLSLPRAASGDSAVRWADALADRDYPTFRMDLPGLGDSEGTATPELLDSINAGGFGAVTASVIDQLMVRYGLTGVILCGHCAGSVSALYAAVATAHCKGLILLDPYFHLPQAQRPKVRQKLSNWARSSATGRLASNVYDRARRLRLVLRGSALPANANMQLLARWKQLATTGMPILLLQAPGIKAQGSKPRVGEFDYIRHVLKLAGRRNRIVAEFVEGADHSFANQHGRQAAERHITSWLAAHFPLAGSKRSALGDWLQQAGEDANSTRRIQGSATERFGSLESGYVKP